MTELSNEGIEAAGNAVRDALGYRHGNMVNLGGIHIDFASVARSAVSAYLATQSTEAPAWWSVTSRNGMHIGLWKSEATANDVASAYEESVVTPLFAQPAIASPRGADWAVKAIEDAQAVLAEYIIPDSGISDFDCVNRLLGILDNQDLVRKQRALSVSPQSQEGGESKWPHDTPFITSVSGPDGKRYISVAVRTNEALHDAHDLVIAAFKQAGAK